MLAGIAGKRRGYASAGLGRRTTTRAARMPTSYNTHIGSAIRAWLKTSGVGVRMAATTKLTRIAYFRFRDEELRRDQA